MLTLASQKARKIIVLETIHIVVHFWNNMMHKYIINCFRNTGFSQIESNNNNCIGQQKKFYLEPDIVPNDSYVK